MIYIIVLSVIAGALGLYYSFFKNTNRFKKHGIPYKSPIPLLGNTGPMFLRLKSLADISKEIYDMYPEAKYVGWFDMMNAPTLMIRDPELIKSIALKHPDTFSDHYISINMDYDPLLGKNLVFLRGEKWRQARYLLSPAFTSSKMKNMFKLMSECGVKFANYLTQLPPEQKITQMKDVFARYTNDVIATCAFGISVDSMRNPENQFYLHGKEAMTFNIIRFIKFVTVLKFPRLAQFINLKVIPQKVANFFRNLIEDTIKTRDENNIVRPDMLQLMMENRGKEGKPELTAEDMVAHAFVFFLAGLETTSSLMCFAAYEIAVNQDVQEKLQKEIDKVLEDTNGQAPYEAINGIEYLDAVINEALRKYPISIMTDRICAQDFELPPTLPGTKPFIIKKGQGLWIPTYGLQHDPKYFEEPEKFDPERFCGEWKRDNLNCGTYLPFGIGPRKCIGNRFALLETKVLLFHLLARCDLKICEKTSIPIKISKIGPNMIIEDGLWLKVLPRKNTHHTLAANLCNEMR